MPYSNKYNMFDSGQRNAIGFKQQGNNFFKEANYQKAIQCYSKSIEIYPLIQTYSNRANAYIFLQRYQEALKDCDSALVIDKSHVKTIIRKGKCLIFLLRIDEGVKLLENSVKNEHKDTARQMIELGKSIKETIDQYLIARGRKDFSRAQQFLNQIFPQMKENIQVNVSMIQCLAKTNKTQALNLLKSVQKNINQTSFIYWYLRGIIQITFGVKIRAKRYMLECIRYFTTQPLKQSEKKMLFEFKLQELNLLLNYITNSQKLINEAESLIANDKPKQAIKKLGAVLDADAINRNERVYALYLRSKCFKKTKDKPKQLNDLNTLLRLNPNYVQGLQARLEFHQAEKNYAFAHRDAENLNKFTSKHRLIAQKYGQFVRLNVEGRLDYYDILDVSRSATTAEINKAYKQLAIIYHPDKNRGLNQQQQQFAKHKFKQIKKAQTCLSDPQKREFYDKHKCEMDEAEEEDNERGGFDFFTAFRGASSSFRREQRDYSRTSYDHPEYMPFEKFYEKVFGREHTFNFPFKPPS